MRDEDSYIIRKLSRDIKILNGGIFNERGIQGDFLGEIFYFFNRFPNRKHLNKVSMVQLNYIYMNLRNIYFES